MKAYWWSAGYNKRITDQPVTSPMAIFTRDPKPKSDMVFMVSLHV